MKKMDRIICSIAILLLLNLACLGQTVAPQTLPNNATVVAMTLTAIALQNPPTSSDNQPTQPAAQPTSVAPAPTNPTIPDAPSPTKKVPCDRATFVSETIPDNTKMKPGQSFSKSWTLKNNGSCPWGAGYTLIFDHGDSMGALPTSPLTAAAIAPGQTVEVAATLTAPNQPGTYQGYFMLKNASGVKFGIGDNADVAFWVKIVVEAAASQADETAIKQALLVMMGWPESDMEFSMGENTGQFARGSLKNKNEISGAAWFAARNSNGKWLILYVGQGVPYCNELQGYNIPTSWISHCVDSAGNTIAR